MSDLPHTYTDAAIRALPLLPDGDTTEDAITDAQDAQLPDRNGDVVTDIRIALDTRVDLTPEHRAFYSEIINRFEGLAADRDQARRTRDRYRNERDEARRWGRILEAQQKGLRQELRNAREATGQPDTNDTPVQVAAWLEGHYDAADDWTPTKATIGNLLREYRAHIASGTPEEQDAAEDPGEPQDETPRDTELIQQVRALVKRYGAPWVAYEAARQARH